MKLKIWYFCISCIEMEEMYKKFKIWQSLIRGGFDSEMVGFGVGIGF